MQSVPAIGSSDTAVSILRDLYLVYDHVPVHVHVLVELVPVLPLEIFSYPRTTLVRTSRGTEPG